MRAVASVPSSPNLIVKQHDHRIKKKSRRLIGRCVAITGFQAPSKRPERDKQAHQHRIYLPLAPQSAPDPSQNPDTIATPGCLLVTSGEYSAKITEVGTVLVNLQPQLRHIQSPPDHTPSGGLQSTLLLTCVWYGCGSQAEDLRKEVKELQASIKEEARKLEAATAALLEESKKLRVQELEADEQRDK